VSYGPQFFKYNQVYKNTGANLSVEVWAKLVILIRIHQQPFSAARWQNGS